MICALLLQLSTISVAYADEVAVPSYLCTFTSANQGDVGPYQISSLYSSNHESDIWNNIIKSTGDSVFKYVGVNVAGNLNDKGPQKIGKNVGDSVTFSVDSTFNLKDSTLKVGEDWFPEDNFLSATNKNGDIVGFSDVDINPKTIDTTKVGETDVTYSLKSDPSLKAVAKINVIKTKATLNVKSSTILINTPWHKKDNFISATDDDGNDMGIDNPDVIIHGTVNTSKVGVYDIIYDTNYMKKKATITVVSSFGSLDFKSAPKTMDFGDVDLKVEKLLKAGIQTKDSDLVISDTRDKKGNWSVTAELSDDLATANGETLPNALYYDKNVLSKDVATTIYTVDGTLQDEDVNLSSNWSDTQGFHLETPRKGIIATDYKCSVTWGLLDVPGGDIK